MSHCLMCIEIVNMHYVFKGFVEHIYAILGIFQVIIIVLIQLYQDMGLVSNHDLPRNKCGMIDHDLPPSDQVSFKHDCFAAALLR